MSAKEAPHWSAASVLYNTTKAGAALALTQSVDMATRVACLLSMQLLETAVDFFVRSSTSETCIEHTEMQRATCIEANAPFRRR